MFCFRLLLSARVVLVPASFIYTTVKLMGPERRATGLLSENTRTSNCVVLGCCIFHTL